MEREIQKDKREVICNTVCLNKRHNKEFSERICWNCKHNYANVDLAALNRMILIREDV
jgi:hypothetical protein